ncbi:hypothetical protein MKY59_07765 [Paenibacillus sp. FSL W8-0426]|uniref:hypothetical protein n=1 Tax=Paenibacillus sp. FSL W8-0426 TaxID=2921714 RepID=UPI0030D88D39
MKTVHWADLCMTYTIDRPKTKEELKRMLLTLKRLAEEGLNFAVYGEEVRKQFIIAVQGEQQFNQMMERLRHEFGLEVMVAEQEPKVLYKTTIGKTVESEGKYIRGYAGGIPKFGVCSLRCEPLPRGEGYVFVNMIEDDEVIPEEYIPAVEEGVKSTIYRGLTGGLPIVDVLVRLYDGAYHEKDSSVFSYKVAAFIGFRNGYSQADPVLLEPYMNVEMKVTHNNANLLLLAAQLLGPNSNVSEHVDGSISLTAEVPLREWLQYREQIQENLTVAGQCNVELAYYDPVPEDLKDTIIETSHLADAYYEDLFQWEKWGKESEDHYLNDYVDSFWGDPRG